MPAHESAAEPTREPNRDPGHSSLPVPTSRLAARRSDPTLLGSEADSPHGVALVERLRDLIALGPQSLVVSYRNPHGDLIVVHGRVVSIGPLFTSEGFTEEVVVFDDGFQCMARKVTHVGVDLMGNLATAAPNLKAAA